MPNTTDAALVSGHLAGDPSALAGIYDRYADTLYDTAAAMLNSRDDAADVLQDTVLIAAERLGQLRDPDRLKPWLFAILRNEVYRRSRARKRTVATDFSGGEDGVDMADDRHPSTDDAVADSMAGAEFAAMLRGAAAGLDERDQLVLELSVRQGLDGQDLADALGVSANQSYTLVHRMRERVERSLGAYAIAKAGRKDCDDLDAILARWDGEFTVLIRKRVARHIDKCSTCSTNRTKVAPLALFAGAPALAAPPELRDRILTKAGGVVPKHDYGFTASDGFPDVLRAARRVAARIPATAAASVILLAAIIGFVVVGGTDESTVQSAAGATTTGAPTSTATTTVTTEMTLSATGADAPTTTLATTTSAVDTTSTTAPPTTPAPSTSAPAPTPPATTPPTTAVVAPPPPAATPPPTTAAPTTTAAPRPGELSLWSALIDLGTTSPSGTTILTNIGDFAVTFQVTGDGTPFTVTPTSGVLQPGQSVSIVASLDRSSMREGDHAASVQVSGDGTARGVTLRARTDRPPVIGTVNGPSHGCATFAAGQRLFISASAPIADETGPIAATFSVSGPNNRAGSTTMGFDAGVHNGVVIFDLGPSDSPAGTWSWSISATDGRGNSASTSGSFQITSC